MMAGSAEALPLNVPVPSNAYIAIGGLDWAWAAPCGAVQSCGDIDLSFQSTLGWHLPTPAEFAVHPDAIDFVFAGANVPLGGSDPVSGAFDGTSSAPGDLACAAPYFSTTHLHCDYSDGASSLWYNPALPGGQGVPETLVVRGQQQASIPEPATLVLLGLGLAGMAFTRRRKTA